MVEDLVDQRIAHLDKQGYAENVTFQDIANSLDLFNKIACKYLALFTEAGYITLKPEIQYNWQKILTVPLDIRKFES